MLRWNRQIMLLVAKVVLTIAPHLLFRSCFFCLFFFGLDEKICIINWSSSGCRIYLKDSLLLQTGYFKSCLHKYFLNKRKGCVHAVIYFIFLNILSYCLTSRSQAASTTIKPLMMIYNHAINILERKLMRHIVSMHFRIYMCQVL